MEKIPKVVILPITNRCNAKCVMCNIWKKDNSQELTLEHYNKIFMDEIIKNNVESVNITGGEPTLRKELLRIIDIIVDNCEKLKSITINTNGFIPYSYKKVLDYIIQKDSNIEFYFYFSLDGVLEHHDKIRGVKGFFERLEKTLDVFEEYKEKCDVSVGFNFTITPYSCDNMIEANEYAKKRGLTIDYTLSMPSETYFDNADNNDLWSYSNEQKIKIKNNLLSFLKENTLSYNRAYYRNLIKMIDGGTRRIGCIFKENGMFITAEGNVYKCWSDSQKLGNVKEETVSNMWENSFNKKVTGSNGYNNCYVNYTRNNSIKGLMNDANRIY